MEQNPIEELTIKLCFALEECERAYFSKKKHIHLWNNAMSIYLDIGGPALSTDEFNNVKSLKEFIELKFPREVGQHHIDLSDYGMNKMLDYVVLCMEVYRQNLNSIHCPKLREYALTVFSHYRGAAYIRMHLEQMEEAA